MSDEQFRLLYLLQNLYFFTADGRAMNTMLEKCGAIPGSKRPQVDEVFWVISPDAFSANVQQALIDRGFAETDQTGTSIRLTRKGFNKTFPTGYSEEEALRIKRRRQ